MKVKLSLSRLVIAALTCFIACWHTIATMTTPVVASGNEPSNIRLDATLQASYRIVNREDQPESIFLPLVMKGANLQRARRVNIPGFVGDIPIDEMAIFWFGKVTPIENYGDVRVAYDEDELYIRVTGVDRRLWYDTSPSPEDITAWDSVSLYLSTTGNQGGSPGTSSYHFIGQLNLLLNETEPDERYQVVYRGTGSGWEMVPLPFMVKSVWRSENGVNNDSNDDGWWIKVRIPYTSLGLSGPPPNGTVWGLAVTLHDRDDEAGTPIPDKGWPENALTDQPGTWGQIKFGLPVYTPPDALPGGSTAIRHGVNNAIVPDGMVGGGATCGDGLHKWSEWGEANYSGARQVNVQNQKDVSDRPCFSKYYLSFPLDSIPDGKVIISSNLTLYHFGNSNPDEAQPSLIQVMTVDQTWDEATLTWNNAPLAWENISRAWVEPLREWPDWPGIPRDWDVSRAVAEAYQAGIPLDIVLYSADVPMHSGKYFFSSDEGQGAVEARPMLTVTWGDPVR